MPTQTDRLVQERDEARAEVRQLRAAVEALCERAETVFDDTVIGIGQVRALLADDGAAALRERDAKVWDEACGWMLEMLGMYGPNTNWRNPYRDTAGGDGDGE